MPTIIGIPAGKMIRTSAISDTDDLGLSRLTETYAFATSEFQTFRTRLINFTPYNTVMNYVYPTPSTNYPYVLIESVNVTEEAGGISMATVQYQGILKSGTASIGDTSWLPPAKQRFQPYTNFAFVTINPISVIVDFIYYSDGVVPELDLIKKYGEKTSLPTSINGTNLYRSIKAPYIVQQETIIVQPALAIAGSATANVQGGTFLQTYSYLGMLCTSHFSERKGLFFYVTNTYTDSFSVTTEPIGGNKGY
jgi:hypothetical protein